MKVLVVHTRCTLGKVGDIIETDDTVNVRALVRSGLVEIVPDKPKKARKKAARKDDD